MTIFTFILALVALGILVFIHELGHYFVARWVGMRVETFSIGFGKPLLKWRRGDVNWQLGWLPFGGYVKIAGMEFGKKEKGVAVDPYQTTGGFFAAPPLKRIAVALAGPVANFILAFLIFVALYAMGGREKPFSEFTQVMGWIDPHSELYAQGVRPGDLLLSLNGKPYTNSKDLLYASMLGDGDVRVQGEHVDYEKKTTAPFDLKIHSYLSPKRFDDVTTTGIEGGASYLILSEPLPEALQKKGVEAGDRLVWAEGELLFSKDTLNYLLNNNHALLTIKRGDQTLLSRQKRVAAAELLLSPSARNELSDWQYEAGLKGKWQQLSLLPYTISQEGKVMGPAEFFDAECKLEMLPTTYYSDLEKPLEVGDVIVAVDNHPVHSGVELLSQLQQKEVQLIVKKEPAATTPLTWKKGDEVFLHSLDVAAINQLASGIGQQNGPKQQGDYRLISGVTTQKYLDTLQGSKAEFEKQYTEQKNKIEKVANAQKRARMMQLLGAEYNKNVLGVVMKDTLVDYNPNPFSLFVQAFTETWQTLRALIFGYLNPKWLSGPIGIVQIIQYGWRVGVGEALFWIAAISLNLGVLNLLPLPVLDGGYITLSLWELITGRKMKAKTMERLIVPFVVLLFGLLIFLTFQDIIRFF